MIKENGLVLIRYRFKMETLLLNNSKNMNNIKKVFDNNQVRVNLKNLLHVEDISSSARGILIINEFDPSFLKPFIDYAKRKNIKILAVNKALLSLVNFLNGSNIKLERPFSGDKSTFISLGSKLAEIIGGAGPLKTNFNYKFEIPIKELPVNYLPSSINLQSGCIEAIESEGEYNILGIIWPIFSNQKIPPRFENILRWISD